MATSVIKNSYRYIVSQFNTTLTTTQDGSSSLGHRATIVISSSIDPNYSRSIVATIPLYAAREAAPGRPFVVSSDANNVVRIDTPIAYTNENIYIRVLYILG